LKGFYYLNILTIEGFKKAIECFENSLQKDSKYSLAYLGLASVNISMSFWGNQSPKKAYPKATEYVKKALEIDNTSAEAHGALGYINMIYEWNWNAAEKEFKQSLNLNPNSSYSHLRYSNFLTFTNRHNEAIEEARLAHMLDPLSSDINTSLGQAYWYACQYDKAMEIQKMIIEMNPNFIPAHTNLALLYAAKSMIKEANEEIKKAVDLSMGSPMLMSFRAIGYLMTGKKVMAQKLIDNLIQRSKNEYIPATCFFHYYSRQPDFDQAYIWLKRAVDEHDSFLPTWILNPIERYSIPNEPRFNELLKKVGLERNSILTY
jgi:tetratricopeptide (TPR) repeat protein